ncbi:hypothetical protein NLU13_6992 [Sarocladium strictum]|uniref:Uncharacterized protein n=1 Tax=Sarocladium strictum TaxID=5046 RepID=A0AA39GEF4_SARSR|nr:hypothetical protein NLU13_6992 [Sarocladium strictum]
MPPPRGRPNILEGPADYDMTKQVHSDTYPSISPLNADLSSRAVFITGASRGIGLEIAVSYARAGASYLALGARSDLQGTVKTVLDAANDAGRPEPVVLPVRVDISSAKSVEAAARQVRDEFGRLDIIVNNSGVLKDMGRPFAESDPDAWFGNYEVNLKGPYLVLRSFIPLLLETVAGFKTVVTISSVGGLLATPGLSGYQGSKWAVLKLTEHAQNEYGGQGLVTYNVHPGNIHTTMLEGELPDYLKPVFVDTAQLTGDALVYLTKEKRDWLAGRYVNLTWDMPELVAKKAEIVEKDMLKLKMVVLWIAMENHQDHIDSLLQRYLLLLDEYTRLRTQLSNLQASVFRDIARANFSAERGLRYGQDHYDERMQALRTVRIEMEEEGQEKGVPVFEVVLKQSDQEDKHGAESTEDEESSAHGDDTNEEDEKEEEEASQKKKVIAKDPLRWFGLLTPQSLRTAQASSIEAVSVVIPRLATLNQEMINVEIQVRRARKKRAKAEAAAGKEPVAAGSGIKAA